MVRHQTAILQRTKAEKAKHKQREYASSKSAAKRRRVLLMIGWQRGSTCVINGLMGMLFLERNRERVAFILFISFFCYIIPHSFIKSCLPSLPVFQPASQFHNFVLFIYRGQKSLLAKRKIIEIIFI